MAVPHRAGRADRIGGGAAQSPRRGGIGSLLRTDWGGAEQRDEERERELMPHRYRRVRDETGVASGDTGERRRQSIDRATIPASLPYGVTLVDPPVCHNMNE